MFAYFYFKVNICLAYKYSLFLYLIISNNYFISIAKHFENYWSEVVSITKDLINVSNLEKVHLGFRPEVSFRLF